MTLDIITHPLLAGTMHGFFGRAGGASSGVYQGLNCGFGSSDQHEVVQINRGRVAKALDTAPENLIGVHQVHSAKAVIVDQPPAKPIEADAMVTATQGLALGILTADCQPVLFADHKAGVIGAAHAGWKGALLGVLDDTVAKMESLGANRADISAVIGPSISQRNYEVGPEFRDDFIAADTAYARFFIQGHDDRFQFDLPAFGLHKMRQCGVGQTAWTGHCTYENSTRFFSYRRSVHQKQADYGRLIGAIKL